MEAYDIFEEKPQWLSNESSFYKVNIKEVVAEMERQYGIKMTGKEHLKDIYFSGRFKHDNLIQATRTVFVAMRIPYEIKDDKRVEIQAH